MAIVTNYDIVQVGIKNSSIASDTIPRDKLPIQAADTDISSKNGPGNTRRVKSPGYLDF